MATDHEALNGRQRAVPEPSLHIPDGDTVTAEEFLESFGRNVIEQTLNVDNWRVGSDLSQEYSRIEKEVRQAVEKESVLQKRIRAEVFPRLKSPPCTEKTPTATNDLKSH